MQGEMVDWMIAEMVEGILEVSTQDPDKIWVDASTWDDSGVWDE
jgi:hypothetical protein